MNVYFYVYQDNHDYHRKKDYCLKLVTDLGPGALAYFLQSALIQINCKYPLVHLSYNIA